MYVVTDTHPWVWFLTASPNLSNKSKSALSDPSNIIIIPSIVMMEIRYLYEKKRIKLTFEKVLIQVETAENILLYPLDISVVTNSPINLDIHDAIIVGTAIQAAKEFGQKVLLITKDKDIMEADIVPVMW
ncbi:MAG: PIN domain-containing protein [Candidatus Scalindua sp.]|nr:PIN domain-containing protein [Candidatus Scalindua sp.]